MNYESVDTMIAAFERSVRVGLESGAWEEFELWSSLEYAAHTDDEPFSEELLQSIVCLFSNQDFLTSTGACNVLKLIEDDWVRLSTSQRTALLPVLADNYITFTDDMSWFLIAEILGEFYADSPALEALLAIKAVAVGKQREMLPMGFQCLVQNAGDATVQERAEFELHSMGTGESRQVKQEVAASKSRIRNSRKRTGLD